MLRTLPGVGRYTAGAVATFPGAGQATEGRVRDGPALLENAYTTLRVLPGWRFELTANRDLLLTRLAQV